MRLRINSGKHAGSDSRIQRRIETLDRNVTSPDVVFTEDSVGTRTLGQFILSLCIAPLLTGVMICWGKIIVPFLQFLTRGDGEIEDHIIEEYDADKIPADASALDLIKKEWKLWAASNWITVGLVMFLGVTQGFLTQFSLMLTIFFGLGVSLFFAFLAGNQYYRNRHISKRIQSHSDQYDEAVLVTGGEHHEGVADLLKNNDAVTVDNPKRE